jgi:hypothetical protein
VVVIEHAADPKKAGAQMVSYPRHLSHTLNANFLGSLIWRRDQNFNSNICSNRWASAAQNQSTIQRNIGGKATLSVVRPVIPVENDRQSEFVSHRSPALEDWTWGHGRGQNRQVPAASQDAESWDLYETTEEPARCLFPYRDCANLGTSTTYSETSSRAAIEKKVCILEKWSLRNCRVEVK